MEPEPTGRTIIWLYAALYLGILAAIFVVLAVAMVLGVEENTIGKVGRFIAFIIQFISAVVSNLFFVSRNYRLFSRAEFWKMVGFSTCVPLVSTGLVLLSGSLGAKSPGALNMVLNCIIAFLAALLGYSSWIGAPVLKALLARRARTDARSFV